MQYKLCGTEDGGCRSHIIPEAFYRHLGQGSGGPLVSVPTNEDARVGRMPIGEYDKDLVCAACERTFNAWDSYGAELLLQRFSSDATPILRSPEGYAEAFQYTTYDYGRLKLFLLSVLWRAAATSRPFFHLIKVGSHEAALRSNLLRADPGSPQEYSCVLTRWTLRPGSRLTVYPILSPYSYRMEGMSKIHMARIFFGPFAADIKVDKRALDRDLAIVMLRPASPLTLLARRLDTSRDLAVMRPAMIRHRDVVNRIAGRPPPRKP